MNIVRVRVRRYRCLKELSLDVDDYTVLVGPNGSGKSSVLYALDWFFNGGGLSEDDLHATSAGMESGEGDAEIDVEVTFGDLTDEDRRVLGRYGRGDTAWFRRTWSKGEEKMIGNARQGPGFAAIRAAPKVGEMRQLYRGARQQREGLDDVTLKDEILAQLDEWENDPTNLGSLEEVEDSDASHMFGFNGERVLARRVRLIVVPASADIVGQISSPGKSNAVSQLVGAVMSAAVSSVRSKWETDHAEQLAQLSDAITRGVEESTQLQAARVNGLLAELIPSATLSFVPDMPTWSIKGDASIQTDVVIDGEPGRNKHPATRWVFVPAEPR